MEEALCRFQMSESFEWEYLGEISVKNGELVFGDLYRNLRVKIDFFVQLYNDFVVVIKRLYF